MIGNCKTAQERKLWRAGPTVDGEDRCLPIPVIAAIIALAWAVGWSWRWRATVAFVLTILKRCSVAEVQLGLLPGSGGPAFTASRRHHSIRLILTGKQLRAKRREAGAGG
ncbi:hypothetical protein ACNKHU_14355 [Shigella flexneri]